MPDRETTAGVRPADSEQDKRTLMPLSARVTPDDRSTVPRRVSCTPRIGWRGDFPGSAASPRTLLAE